MNPNRVDSLVDLAYGVLILVAIVLMVVVGSSVGAAFGIGVFVAYAVHVVWKMARYDPEWMSREVVQQVEADLAEDVSESVEKSVTADVAEAVEETVTSEVAETVEETVADEVEDVKEKVEEVNERVDRRPRADEIAETVGEVTQEED